MKYKLHTREAVSNTVHGLIIRTVVPGGWLYDLRAHDRGVAVALCFVSDSNVEIEE